MAHARVIPSLLVTALILLAGMVVGGACASTNQSPVTVSLAQLATNQESYNGQKVETRGIVRQFANPDGAVYYVIEDSQPNRVELKPADAASGYVGQQVAVTGTFHLDNQVGRWITAERVSALDT
jgi:hypothetical protein